MSPSEAAQPRGGTGVRPAPRASGPTAGASAQAGAPRGSGQTASQTAVRGGGSPAPAPVATEAPAGPHAARRVRLTASRINPWSVLKLSFLLSVALGIIAVVAVFILWSVLHGMGVFTKLDSVVSGVVGSESSFNVLSVLSLAHVMSVTVVLAIVDVVLLTVLSTLAALLYNLASTLVGGVRLTLTDD